jgi:two-component system NtrC family sensor kinase
MEEVILRNTQLEIINEVAKAFNINLPVEEIICILVDKLKSVIKFDYFSLLIQVDGVYKLYTKDFNSSKCHILDNQLDEITSYIFQFQTSLYLPEDLNLLPNDKAEVHYSGSALFIPLIVKNRVIGVLGVNGSYKLAYSRQDILFMEQLGELLSVGINNIMLYSEVFHREREYEETFRAITDALVVIDTDFEIIRSNETAKKLLKLEFPLNKRKKCYEIIHHREKSCTECPLASGSYHTRRDYHLPEEDSKEVYDIYAYPIISHKSRVKGVVGYFKNVTQQKVIEAQLVQSEKLAAIGKLAAGVAHELNSPLTAILGNAQLLLREFPEKNENLELLADIKECGIRCKNIIRNLLTFARQQPMSLGPIAVNDVLTRAVSLVTHQITQEQIELTCSQESSLPNIVGNCQQLEQVIINLLVNAKDAFEDCWDGKAKKKKIIIKNGCSTKEGRNYIFISVEDNGCGMDEETLANIFTPFFTKKAVGKGTGLGLAVSLGIIQNHGGSIECISKGEGKGSKFTVWLPV